MPHVHGWLVVLVYIFCMFVLKREKCYLTKSKVNYYENFLCYVFAKRIEIFFII